MPRSPGEEIYGTFEPASNEDESKAQVLQRKRGLIRLVFLYGRRLLRNPYVVLWMAAVILVSVFDFYIKIILPILFGVPFLGGVIFCGIARSRMNKEMNLVISIKKLPYFQNLELIAKAREQPGAQCYYKGVLFQPREGYCGHATVNNVLQSIGSKSLLKFPAVTRPINLDEMGLIWEGLRESSLDPKLKQIKTITLLSNFNSFEQFHEEVKLVNNPKFRFCCNFLRGPLFFSDPQDTGATLRRLLSGHWSPLVSYLPPSTMTETSTTTSTTTSTSTDTASTTVTVPKNGLVLIFDVNHRYGPFLVPTERLFDAVNTRDIFAGAWRGLVKIELEDEKSEGLTVDS